MYTLLYNVKMEVNMKTSSERELYIRKLDFQISGMTELLNPKFQDIISQSKATEINKLLNKAKKLKTKLSNNEFEIAIIGLEKAGKSTFANALMGNDILPSMEPRCTYTSTSIRYGENDYAEIIFFSRDEFNKKLIDNLVTMGIEHAENYDFTTLSLNKYRELFEQLSDEKKNFYRANVNEDVENILEHKDTLISHVGSADRIYKGAEQLESDEFKKYIQDSAFAVAVKEITIHSSKLVDMQNAIIYDVPGFDSPTQIHKEQTIHMMATADVIIMIASTNKPSITGPQVQIFEGEVDQDGIPFNEKTFVFGNKSDTVNDSIETNVQVLKGQLERYRIVRSDYIDHRLVIGSARAKLEKEGKISNTGAYEKLAEKGINDGIDEIHKRLETYNNTERFEILKKRINRIYSELQECLAPVLDVLKDSAGDNFNINEISSITIRLLDEAKETIQKNLYSLRSEIQRTFSNPSCPLTSKFKELISSINSEVYVISEQEKESAVNEVSTTGSNIALDEFERTLRKNKYNAIYDYFTKTVIDIAISTHNEYDEKIINIFLDAFNINSSHPYYKELLESIKEYLKFINPENREGYYRSLSERFATDLFETLIRQNFGGRDRWSAFKERKLNLYSLSIFHEENVQTLPADRQPMLYSILFHNEMNGNKKEDDYINTLLSVIKSYVPEYHSEIEEKFTPLLRKVMYEKKDESLEYLENVCERRPHSSAERFIDALFNYLSVEFEDVDDIAEPQDSAPFPEITFDYYNERCKSENLNSSNEDTICLHIHNDIDILGDILLKAAIPAIQIDKAFTYYVVRSIENIINSVDARQKNLYKFGDFVAKNTDKIACGQLADIEAEEKKRILHREICSEIQKILTSVKMYEK